MAALSQAQLAMSDVVKGHCFPQFWLWPADVGSKSLIIVNIVASLAHRLNHTHGTLRLYVAAGMTVQSSACCDFMFLVLYACDCTSSRVSYKPRIPK